MTHTRRVAVVAAALSAAIVLHAQQTTPKSDLFDASLLLKDLQTLSADDMQGRQPGTPGSQKARAFIVERFKASGVMPIGASYERPFGYTSRSASGEQPGVNVVGWINGSKSPARYLVITAHYDHLGVRNGTVFNGADDNASGTAALFTLAKYFNANRTAHSLIFAALDAEEVGLRGAQAFVKQPPVEASALILNLNMDMIGRDPNNLLYVVGTHQLGFLKPYIERVAARAPVKLVMGHDNPAQASVEDWSAQSDHHAFCQAKIPCLYFGVEDFDQHHRPTDDYETMSHAFYVRAVETMILAIKEFDAGLDAIALERAKMAKGGVSP
jgi:Zn-dependent M28 family amino/carboxypeptidase